MQSGDRETAAKFHLITVYILVCPWAAQAVCVDDDLDVYSNEDTGSTTIGWENKARGRGKKYGIGLTRSRMTIRWPMADFDLP
jgi:hypothetical protein